MASPTPIAVAASAAPDPVTDIELVPVTIAEIGVSSVSPRGWTEMPGASFEDADARLQFLAVPAEAAFVPTDDGFELIEHTSIGDRDWDIFALETTEPGVGSIGVRMAITRAADMTYGVAVAAPADLADRYVEVVGIPALEAFEVIGTAAQSASSYDEVLEQMGRNGPGAALVVDRDGQHEFDSAHGTVAMDDPTPLTTDTPFRTASTTKPMTAVVILHLAEMGLLDVDQTIDSYLPADLVDRVHVLDGVSRGGQITIRMLLQHTAGLPDRVDTEYIDDVIADPDRQWTPTDLVEWRIDNLDPLFAPGDGFSYSDDGYVLLGMIAETTTGRPLQELYREFVFDPAGMTTSYLEGQEPARGRPIAHSYLGEIDATNFHPSIDWGGGGVASTPTDLVRFGRALADSSLFDNQATAEAMTVPGPHPTSDLPPSGAVEVGYGSGLMILDIDGTTVFGHGGFWGSMMLIAPDDGLVVVANINNSEAGRATITGAVQAMRLALRNEG